MLPKFIEDCNRLLPDGEADSVRCMRLCAHSTCHSTTPARELSANIQRKQWPPNSPNLISCLGSDARSFLNASSEAKIVSELKVALEKTRENFPQNKAVTRF